jgi:hypothetical protein
MASNRCYLGTNTGNQASCYRHNYSAHFPHDKQVRCNDSQLGSIFGNHDVLQDQLTQPSKKSIRNQWSSQRCAVFKPSANPVSKVQGGSGQNKKRQLPLPTAMMNLWMEVSTVPCRKSEDRPGGDWTQSNKVLARLSVDGGGERCRAMNDIIRRVMERERS